MAEATDNGVEEEAEVIPQHCASTAIAGEQQNTCLFAAEACAEHINESLARAAAGVLLVRSR